MNQHSLHKATGHRLSLAAACLCTAMAGVSLAGAQTVPTVSTNSSEWTVQAGGTQPRLVSPEKEEDRQHLQRIYKAIIAYYRDHQDLPNWLSDLVPQYLPDPNDLISPVETRTGKSVLYGRTDPNLRTSYVYEFNAGPAPEEFNRGRAVPLTCKQWKLMQLEKFGLVTPILRCHLHNPVLNVAYGGTMYETGLLWENDPRTGALIKANPSLGPKPATASATVVNVRVVDADTGEPVEAASVSSTPGSEFGLLPPGNGVANTNGVVAVPLGEWQVNFLMLTVSHPLYQPAHYEWNREKAIEKAVPSEIIIKLARYSPNSSR